MSDPYTVSIIAAGWFLLFGLITGAIKYIQIANSDKGRAHYYMDICHRASLMYAFACVVIAHICTLSQLNEQLELICIWLLLLYFGLSIGAYFIHGLLQDTTNQLRKPHQLGTKSLPNSLMSGFMWSLIAAEIGAFSVLLYGAMTAI